MAEPAQVLHHDRMVLARLGDGMSHAGKDK
jgi:hypothetical protein